MYKCRPTQIHRRLRGSGTHRLLTSEFCSSTRKERQFLRVFRNHTMLTTSLDVRHISCCFRSQLIFAGRDPKNLTATATVENSTLWLRTPFSAPMAEAQYGPISNPQLHGQTSTSQHPGRTPTSQHHGRTSTENFSIINLSLLSMTISTLQSHFLSGV